MKVLKGKNVIVYEGDLKRREEANRDYFLQLTNDNLLFNYKVEAGRYHGRDYGTGISSVISRCGD